MALESFKLRGNYPNQRSLYRSMELRYSVEDDSPLPLPGYRPPVARFVLDGEPGDLTIRDVDIPFLFSADRGAVEEHLRLILRSRDGEPKACGDLTGRIRRHFHEMSGVFRNLELVDTAFVVPSTSGQTYSQEQVSHKGSILLRLSRLGCPVPDFVILTSSVYLRRKRMLESSIRGAIKNLEALTCQKLLFSKQPLLIAVRCAMPRYVPGLMPTFLNVGVTEGSLPDIEKAYGRLAAHKCFLNNLRNMVACLDRPAYRRIRSAIRHDLPPKEVDRLIQELSDIVRAHDAELLKDPVHQVRFFVGHCYKQFEENRDLLLTLSRGKQHHPSIILQKMVCTVRSDDSFAGFLCSRHSKTGEGRQLETARNIFGEEIMTGTVEPERTDFIHRDEVREVFPAIYHFAPRLDALEKEFEAPVMIECGAEAVAGSQLFALLQLNILGMTGRAAVVSVVDMHKAGVITRRRVTELVHPFHIKQIESDSIDEESFSSLVPFGEGAAVLPRGAVSARAYFSAESALRAKRRGEKVAFCKDFFKPTDSVVMREMDAIISLTSAAIHVVTICQTYGAPALLNVEKEGVRLTPEGLINPEGLVIAEGDWVTISSRRHRFYKGKALYRPARLIRYMRGEPTALPQEVRRYLDKLAYAYRYYQQLVRGMKLEQIESLNELIRLVNFDLRGDAEKAAKLVNSWFEVNETRYVAEVFKSEMGDHLNQHKVFGLLGTQKKVRFFEKALARCARERIFGFSAGAFMLGRFLSSPLPAAFWSAFGPLEYGLMINEWVLFEKYMQILNETGERRVSRARRKILEGGLGDCVLNHASMKALVPLKLSGPDFPGIRAALPDWADPQTAEAVDLLASPYGAFYDFDAAWSRQALEKLCAAEDLPMPGPDDV